MIRPRSDEITVAMLQGWHARNGESLGNPRLGFVCTKTTTAGDAALEGYYLEHDRALEPGERLRFARHEEGPDFDPARAPVLGSVSWPPARLAKARRNYAMEYLRTALPVAVERLGEADADRVVRLALRQVGMQHYREAAAVLGLASGGGAAGFARFLAAMARGQGDAATVRAAGDTVVVEQSGPRLLDGVGPARGAVIGAWSGLWEGALAAHDRRLGLHGAVLEGPGAPRIAWTIGPR